MAVITDLNEYLRHPLMYLLQKHSMEHISTIRDINGYSLLHCAVLKNSLSKVIEIIHTEFPLNTFADNSEIPLDLIVKFIPFDFNNSFCDDFLEGGYTPLHLSLYLFNYYSNFQPHKKSFVIQQFRGDQFKILEAFIEKDKECIGIKDEKGFTLFDYAFLFENILLINNFFEIDPSFKHLNIVESKTALQILEVIKIKDTKNVLNNPFGVKIKEDVFINLKKYVLFDSLGCSLNDKSVVQSLSKI